MCKLMSEIQFLMGLRPMRSYPSCRGTHHHCPMEVGVYATLTFFYKVLQIPEPHTFITLRIRSIHESSSALCFFLFLSACRGFSQERPKRSPRNRGHWPQMSSHIPFDAPCRIPCHRVDRKRRTTWPFGTIVPLFERKYLISNIRSDSRISQTLLTHSINIMF